MNEDELKLPYAVQAAYRASTYIPAAITLVANEFPFADLEKVEAMLWAIDAYEDMSGEVEQSPKGKDG